MAAGSDAPRRRRRIWLAALIALAVLLAGSAGAAAAVYHHQAGVLEAARSERDAQLHAVDTALDAARGAAVEPARLAPVVSARDAVVRQEPRDDRLALLRGSEADQVRREAASLHDLAARVPGIVAAATDAARRDAQPKLDDLAAAIADAGAHGVDPGDAPVLLDDARQRLSSATTPAVVEAAVAALPVRAGDLRASVVAHEQALASAAKAQLDGATADARSALGRADAVLAQAQALPQLQLGGDPAAVAAAHAGFAKATSIADFQAVTSQARGAAADLQGLLGARSSAYAAMAQARSTVTTAINAKVDPGTAPSQLDALQPQLDGAGTASAFTALSAQINAVVQPLVDKLNLVDVGAGKVIVISLTRQSLTAYQDGAVLRSMLVTTGRPVLPTPPGNFSVVRKNSPWLMRSEYPPGSIGWYPPTWVQYVLWFRSDGYGIHDASWQPDSTLGPGSQYSRYSSHGCVHVTYGMAQWLYSWADIGTRVIVH